MMEQLVYANGQYYNGKPAELPFYINRRCHTGQLKERTLAIAGTIGNIIELADQRLQQVEPTDKQSIAVTFVRSALDPLAYPATLLKEWQRADQDVPKLLGNFDAEVDPEQIDYKLGEFLVALEPFASPEHARHYLAALAKNIGRLTSLEVRESMGMIQVARRTFTVGRVFKHGFIGGVWLSRPKEPIPDEEIANLVASDSPKLPGPRRKAAVWWRDEPSNLAPWVYAEQAAADINDQHFPLARLERFLRVQAMADPEYPIWEKQASRAIFSAYTDCIDAGLQTEARELMAKYDVDKSPSPKS